MKHYLQRLLPAFICLFTVMALHAQVTNDFRSVATGDWSAVSTWEKYNGTAWIAATAVPSSTGKVTIRQGHTVTITGTTSFRDTLVIETGAVLTSNLSSPSGNRLNPFSATATAVIMNNGVLGSSGTGDGITLQTSAGPALIITGSGYARVTKLVPRAAVTIPQTITIDQDMVFSGTGIVFSAYANSSACVTAENCTLTINAGKTVRIPAGAFHIYNASTTPNPAGNYTYNINGTLDLSSSAVISSFLPFSTNTASALTLTVNGTVKTGAGWVMANTGGSGYGTVNCTVNNGGVFDASAAATLTTSTAANGSFIVLNGGVIKRYAGTTAITFPVGTAANAYSPLMLSNSGTADTFTVSIKNIFDHTPVAPTQVVNKQWTITEQGTGASVTPGFGWVTTDQATGFSAAGTVNVMNYTSAWNNYALATAVSGSGTGADPYIATANQAFTSFGAFGVTNGTLLPLQLLSFTAVNAGDAVKLNWVTANEINTAYFDIQESTNGQDFASIGTVKANNTPGENVYAFTDTHPSGNTTYYRLKMTDKDGSFSLSHAVLVSNNTNSVFFAYPNPASGRIAVQHGQMPAGSVLEIYDAGGRRMGTYPVTPGTAYTQVILAGYAKGNYFVVCMLPSGNKRNLSFIVQ